MKNLSENYLLWKSSTYILNLSLHCPGILYKLELLRNSVYTWNYWGVCLRHLLFTETWALFKVKGIIVYSPRFALFNKMAKTVKWQPRISCVLLLSFLLHHQYSSNFTARNKKRECFLFVIRTESLIWVYFTHWLHRCSVTHWYKFPPQLPILHTTLLYLDKQRNATT